MALEETIENNGDNYEEEGEVNLEGDLISSLSDLKRGRKTSSLRKN